MAKNRKNGMRSVQQAIAEGFEVAGESYSQRFLDANTIKRTGVVELEADGQAGMVAIPFTAILRFGRPQVSA